MRPRHGAVNRDRRGVPCDFLFGATEADAPNWAAEFLPRESQN